MYKKSSNGRVIVKKKTTTLHNKQSITYNRLFKQLLHLKTSSKNFINNFFEIRTVSDIFKKKS